MAARDRTSAGYHTLGLWILVRLNNRRLKHLAPFPTPAVQVRRRWGVHWFACKALEPRIGLGAAGRCAFGPRAIGAAPVAARIALEKVASAKSVRDRRPSRSSH